MRTTSGGCSSASSKARSASLAVRTLIPCSRRNPTSARATVRPGATISPSTSLGNGRSLLCVVLSSGSIAQALASMITERVNFELSLPAPRRQADTHRYGAGERRAGEAPYPVCDASRQSDDRRGVNSWWSSSVTP